MLSMANIEIKCSVSGAHHSYFISEKVIKTVPRAKKVQEIESNQLLNVNNSVLFKLNAISVPIPACLTYLKESLLVASYLVCVQNRDDPPHL